MTTTEFELRVGPMLHRHTECEGCECPPSRVKRVQLPCSGYFSGVVTDARTGDELEDVSIWAESPETGSYGEAVTDGLGRFKVGPLEPGEGYALIVSGPDYSYRLLENKELLEAGLVQNVEMVRTGAVRGTIRSSGKKPVQGAKIYLTQQDDPAWGRGEATTDSAGQFCFCDVDVSSLSELNGSNYEVLVLQPEHSFIATTLWIVPRYSASDEVPFNDIMPKRATVQGIVTSGGAPLPGAVVGLSEDSNGLLEDGSDVITDAAGGFSLRVNAPATYTLFAEGDQTSTAETTFRVTPGVTVPLILEAAPPGSIYGVVLHSAGAPVSNALVKVVIGENDENSVVASVVSVEGGGYNINRVPPSRNGEAYIVRAWVPDGAGEYAFFAEKSGVVVTSDTDTPVELRGDS